MFKVIWTNKFNDGGSAIFSTEEEANKWKESLENNATVGRDERWERETDSSHTDTRIVDQTTEYLFVIPERWSIETDGFHTDTRIVNEATEYYFPEVQEWRTVTDETHTDTRLVGGVTEYFFTKEYTITIEDITAQYENEQRLKNLIAQGDLDKQKCEIALNVIRGHNKANNLTSEQILTMMQSFSQIDLALKSGMPVTAKALITAAVADGVVVAQQLKDDLIMVL